MLGIESGNATAAALPAVVALETGRRCEKRTSYSKAMAGFLQVWFLQELNNICRLYCFFSS
jgi:hypothetical protein